MKNINYDLIKLLHSKLDNCWRLEKFYCQDATEAECASIDVLKKILEDEKRHVDMLKKELERRMTSGIFD